MTKNTILCKIEVYVVPEKLATRETKEKFLPAWPYRRRYFTLLPGWILINEYEGVLGVDHLPAFYCFENLLELFQRMYINYYIRPSLDIIK